MVTVLEKSQNNKGIVTITTKWRDPWSQGILRTVSFVGYYPYWYKNVLRHRNRLRGTTWCEESESKGCRFFPELKEELKISRFDV